MSANNQTGKVYRSAVLIQIGGNRKTDADDCLEFRIDLNNRKAVAASVAPEFVVKPRRQFVDEGQPALFKMSFDGTPDTRVLWTVNGEPVERDAPHAAYERDGFHFLELDQVSESDRGTYECTVENSAGRASVSADLEVFVKSGPHDVKIPGPTLVQPLKDITVTEGDRNVVIDCRVSGATKDCCAMWFKDGKEVKPGREFRTKFDNRIASLTISETLEEDNGQYECVISGAFGELRTAGSITVEVSNEQREPPVFVRELHDMEVANGDKVELVVEVKGSQPINVFWIHDNQEILPQDVDYTLVTNGDVHKLVVNRMHKQDSGEYVCEAYNDFGDTDTFCRLQVRDVDIPFAPDFITKPRPLTVTEGSYAVFSCQVSGYPMPEVTWEHEGQPVDEGSKYKCSTQGEEHVLEIFDVREQDSGKYLCRLTNTCGMTLHSTSLIATDNATSDTQDFRSILKPRSVNEKPVVKQMGGVVSERPDQETKKASDLQQALYHRRAIQNQQTASSEQTATSQQTATSEREQHDFRGVLRTYGGKFDRPSLLGLQTLGSRKQQLFQSDPPQSTPRCPPADQTDFRSVLRKGRSAPEKNEFAGGGNRTDVAGTPAVKSGCDGQILGKAAQSRCTSKVESSPLGSLRQTKETIPVKNRLENYFESGTPELKTRGSANDSRPGGTATKKRLDKRMSTDEDSAKNAYEISSRSHLTSKVESQNITTPSSKENAEKMLNNNGNNLSIDSSLSLTSEVPSAKLDELKNQTVKTDSNDSAILEVESTKLMPNDDSKNQAVEINSSISASAAVTSSSTKSSPKERIKPELLETNKNNLNSTVKDSFSVKSFPRDRLKDEVLETNKNNLNSTVKDSFSVKSLPRDRLKDEQPETNKNNLNSTVKDSFSVKSLPKDRLKDEVPETNKNNLNSTVKDSFSVKSLPRDRLKDEVPETNKNNLNSTVKDSFSVKSLPRDRLKDEVPKTNKNNLNSTEIDGSSFKSLPHSRSKTELVETNRYLTSTASNSAARSLPTDRTKNESLEAIKKNLKPRTMDVSFSRIQEKFSKPKLRESPNSSLVRNRSMRKAVSMQELYTPERKRTINVRTQHSLTNKLTKLAALEAKVPAKPKQVDFRNVLNKHGGGAVAKQPAKGFDKRSDESVVARQPTKAFDKRNDYAVARQSAKVFDKQNDCAVARQPTKAFDKRSDESAVARQPTKAFDKRSDESAVARQPTKAFDKRSDESAVARQPTKPFDKQNDSAVAKQPAKAFDKQNDSIVSKQPANKNVNSTVVLHPSTLLSKDKFLSQQNEKTVAKQTDKFLSKQKDSIVAKQTEKFLSKQNENPLAKQGDKFSNKQSNATVSKQADKFLSKQNDSLVAKQAEKFMNKQSNNTPGKVADKFLNKQSDGIVAKQKENLLTKHAVAKQAETFLSKQNDNAESTKMSSKRNDDLLAQQSSNSSIVQNGGSVIQRPKALSEPSSNAVVVLQEPRTVGNHNGDTSERSSELSDQRVKYGSKPVLECVSGKEEVLLADRFVVVKDEELTVPCEKTTSVDKKEELANISEKPSRIVVGKEERFTDASVVSLRVGTKEELTGAFEQLQRVGKSDELNSISEKATIGDEKEELTDTSETLPRSVGEEEELTERAPRVEKELCDQRVKYGSKVVLECVIAGDDIHWSVNGKDVTSPLVRMSYTDTSVATLTIAETYSEDEGEYVATVTNRFGSSSTSCHLVVDSSSSHSSKSDIEGHVTIPARISSLVANYDTILRGEPLELRVTTTGEPPPNVSWFRGRLEIIPDDRIALEHTSDTSVLRISNVTQNDAGRYVAVTENHAGSDRASMSVRVEDIPEPPIGKPQPTAVVRSAITLSWYGPAYDGGCQVTHYRIEGRRVGDKTWVVYHTHCKNTFYQIDDLQPNTAYVFRVSAGNKHGYSCPGNESEEIVTENRLQSSSDYESDGPLEVFSPTVKQQDDELPFEPREVKISPSRVFEDDYEVLHEVGRGKFGNVYQCKAKDSGKLWAAKIVKCREKEKVNVRHEVDIMNTLAHPKLLLLWDAFEAPRKMVLVMEYIGGGELFERVSSDDFCLTERDCVHFMRQICSGVAYMHGKGVLHLDLKPENILCIAEGSNLIKIIDFGLARRFNQGESIKVMFGTPEFIAPEVVNYDEIDFATDMWSIGVICYVLLSGLSPFMGDNDSETLSNVTCGEYDFDDEAFEDISDNAKDFIQHLLVKNKRKRSTVHECQKHIWLAQDERRIRLKRLNTEKLRRFMARRKWQKTGTAIRALGRMASLQRLVTASATNNYYGSGSSSTDPNTSFSSSSSHSPDIQSPTFHANTFSSPTSKVQEEEEEEEESSAEQTAESSREVTQRNVNHEAVCSREVTGTEEDTNVFFAEQISELKPEVKQGNQKQNPVCASETDNEGEVTAEHIFIPREISEKHLEPLTDVVSQAETFGEEIRIFKAVPAISIRLRETTPSSSSETSDTDPSTDGIHPVPKRNGHIDNRLAPSPESSHPESSHPGPKFAKKMVDCQAFKGDVVRFDVRVDGDPLPSVTWCHEGEVVAEGGRRVVEVGSDGHHSLIIRRVGEEDDGEYTARATNSRGVASCSAELIICGSGAF